MNTVTFNNRLGSRSLTHMNLLIAVVSGQTLIFPFTGETTPGVATVVSTRYEKNGKWSFSEWSVELADGIQSFVWSQDWELGSYVTAGTWTRAIEDVRRISGIPDLCPIAIERFIRSMLGKAAAKLDEAARAAQSDPTPVLAELLAAQAELAAAQAERAAAQAEAVQMATEIQQAIDAREQAEQARQEAKATAERVSKAKLAMAKGASLADLKAMLEG